MNRRSTELINIFQDLYEDKVKNLLSTEDSKLLSYQVNKERWEIEEALSIKEKQLQKLRETISNVEAFIKRPGSM